MTAQIYIRKAEETISIEYKAPIFNNWQLRMSISHEPLPLIFVLSIGLGIQ